MGARLREWSKAHRRPLVWVNPPSQNSDSAMLLDPLVDGVAGGRVTAADVALFKEYWTLPRPGQWERLAKASPPHLRFHYRSWDKRHVCAAAESDETGGKPAPQKIIILTNACRHFLLLTHGTGTRKIQYITVCVCVCVCVCIPPN